MEALEHAPECTPVPKIKQPVWAPLPGVKGEGDLCPISEVLVYGYPPPVLVFAPYDFG